MTKWTESEVQFLIENHGKMTTKEMANTLSRDYSVTKRMVKKHILDIQEMTLPDGFVTISDSPIHAINNKGNVIRIRTRQVISPSINQKGYLQVCLQNKKSYRVHRLVACQFVSNPDNKPQVNHIDGDKTNNHFSNLEWVTNAENQSHAISTGLWDGISEKISARQKGEGNSRSKLSEKDVLNIYSLLNQGVRVGVIAKSYSVNHANIVAIKNGKSWQHLYSLYSESSTTRT